MIYSLIWETHPERFLKFFSKEAKWLPAEIQLFRDVEDSES